MSSQFDDYAYVIWADLDFLLPWDVANVVETILHPEQEWDAVLANGEYDLYALRDAEFPIGEELLGRAYWELLDQIRSQFVLDPKDPWRPVYSAFGGLGIYKRESIRGCVYSGTVTKDLEKLAVHWLEEASESTCLYSSYLELLETLPIVDVKEDILKNRGCYANDIGVRLFNRFGNGKIVWFSTTEGCTLPETCEHVTFHAAMIAKGCDQIFINPKITSK